MKNYLLIEVNEKGDRTPKQIISDLDDFLESFFDYSYGIELYPIASGAVYSFIQPPIFSSLDYPKLRGKELKEKIDQAVEETEGKKLYYCEKSEGGRVICCSKHEAKEFLRKEYAENFAKDGEEFNDFLCRRCIDYCEAFNYTDEEKELVYKIFCTQELKDLFRNLVTVQREED